ncbi:hypothetical protein CAOG_01810 [Capsaspora owczarzaki ATCC 30864]|uniref:hypothetical protein n=1 Tax=Capsaspora owczarzaki (strain ATCC 30864) TaxID=595528 RepID=UPI0001FE44E5|nr:hypothetical protein CAOG_01810 [Capsaspora owczarzaki ATCC 30864]|eukprot:XP_004364678.1 hypothetical protein CAOG_01810 [Capsaspora owczarzaki ATCC 30864]
MVDLMPIIALVLRLGLALTIVLVAVLVAWFLAWKLVLSKMTFIREIFGFKDPSLPEAAYTNKRALRPKPSTPKQAAGASAASVTGTKPGMGPSVLPFRNPDHQQPPTLKRRLSDPKPVGGAAFAAASSDSPAQQRNRVSFATTVTRVAYEDEPTPDYTPASGIGADTMRRRGTVDNYF